MAARSRSGYLPGMTIMAMAWMILALATPEDSLSEVSCAFMPAFFQPGSATLGENEARLFTSGYLEAFGVIANPRARISLAGIAIDGGSEAGNRRLAERRERAVRALLMSRGMRADQIDTRSRDRMLAESASWNISSTNGRAVIIEVWIPNADLVRVMPPGGPIC